MIARRVHIFCFCLCSVAGSDGGAHPKANRYEAPPITPHIRVGDPESPSVLRKLDQEVRRYGINAEFRRDIISYDADGAIQPPLSNPTSTAYVIVNYKPVAEDAQFGHGVLVWYELKTGHRCVIPKRALRAADASALSAGFDLTRYSRAIRAETGEYRFTYSIQTPNRNAEATITDGQFSIKVDSRSGKVVPKIFWWDGSVTRLRPLPRTVRKAIRK